MKSFKIILLAAISLVLVAAGWIYQAGLSAGQTVFSSTYYHEAVAETELTSYIHEVEQDRLMEEMSAEMPDNMAMVVTRVFLTVFDEQWVGEKLLVVSDDVVLYITGEQPALRAVIDLREEKEQLGKNLELALTVIPGQILSMLGFDPQELDDLAVALVEQMPLPDLITVQDLLAMNSLNGDLASLLNMARHYHSYYLYVSFAVFILMLFAAYRLAGIPAALKWFGASAVISGAGFYIAMQAGRFVLPTMFELGMVDESFYGSEAYISVMNFSVERMLHIPAYYTLFGILVVLAGLLTGSFYFNRAKVKSGAENE